MSPAADALAAHDLPTPLTRDDARASVPWLSDAAFEARWRATEGDAHKVLRSFPDLWWRDLRALPAARVPQGRAVGFGDAHVENFGWLAFEGGVRFAFNDLDDAGLVEVSLDLLRHLTSASLSGDPIDLEGLARAWRDAVLSPGAPTRALANAPSAAKMREAALEDWDDPAKSALSPVAPDVTRAVAAALAATKATARYEVRAVRRRVVRDGGSGGLARLWAQVRGDGDLDVIELKEMAPPGAEEGRGAVRLDPRLKTLRAVLWGAQTLRPCHRVDVALPGAAPAAFLARSRGMRASWKKKQGPRPFVEQASILGAVHAHAAGQLEVSVDAVAEWALASRPALTDRWRALAALVTD